MALSVLSWGALAVPVLVNVAFFTLMERKVLGLSQSRKGPSKVSVYGILQPVADAVKLFAKEIAVPTSSARSVFFGAPAGALTLALLVWGVVGCDGRDAGLVFSAVAFLVFLSLGLYPLLLAGWASMSAYATVGAMRGVAQTVSYEISLALLLLSFLSVTDVMSWAAAGSSAPSYAHVWGLLPVLLCWLVCCVAETNRTPFDFAEGESELVSGFNVEYGGGLFALIFMAEYAMMLALSAFTAAISLGKTLGPSVALTGVGLAYLWVWLRATLPRYRYDKLMSLAWTALLPLTLGFLLSYSLL